jgi:NADH-quinone oxidoreductase subunit L
MTVPLIILAVFALAAGWSSIPANFPLLGGIIPNWFGGFVGTMLGEHETHEAFNYIPLLTSLLVSLGGLTLGWLVYRKVRTQTDPLEKPLGVVYTLLRRKYFFDELYNLIFYRPAKWFAETVSYRWIDRGLLDGILHGIAKGGWLLGKGLRQYFDIPVVNKGGDALSQGTRSLGGTMRAIQSGRVQQYLVTAIILLVIAAAIIFFVL